MIAITGGGTGGHLSVARAIKNELNDRGIKPIYIGSQNGQDKSWFEGDEGFSQSYFFDTRGVVNKGKLGKIKSLFNILLDAFNTRRLFKEHNITHVFSVGGYSAAPASFASVFFGKKLYIHEQNAHIGALNKLLKRYATAFFSSYHDISPLKDYPIDTRFFEQAHVRKSVKTIIFLGGSQGASAINNFAMEVAAELSKKGIFIIHQTGKHDYEKILSFYTENRIKCDVFDFSTALDAKINQADFAVSRSGASTLWELAASGVPTLFIPYPYAAGDHQYYNAKFLSEKNIAFLVRESELQAQKLYPLLECDIAEISKTLINSISKNGAKEIVDYMLHT